MTCIGAEVAGANVSNNDLDCERLWRDYRKSGTLRPPVIVSHTGQLGTAASSERFKKDIATMEKASETILALAQAGHIPLQDRPTPQAHRNLV